MSIKISVIGAGSAVFSLSLIKDICLTPNLNGSTVSFMDIDQDRLDCAYDICCRYAKELGIDIHLEKTADRKECLKGADFVINTALEVDYDKWKEGWNIAKKHGYRYGGSFDIMHDEAFWINFYQYRLMESIYLDMQIICPDAWYVLVANPVLAGITYLKRKYPDGKIVGLCHGYSGIYHVAQTLGLDEKDISYEVSGVNHLIWLTHFTYKGEDAFPILNKWIVEKSEDYWKTCSLCNGVGPKAVDLYRRYGVFPIGDTGNPGGGSWGYWYHTDKETENKWREDPAWWFDKIYFEANENKLNAMRKAHSDRSIKVTEMFPPNTTKEPMIPLIESIAFDIPRLLIINTLNDNNYVQGVPENFEVEIPALVSKRGIQGIKCKQLPSPVIAHILRDRVAPVEMEIEAYIKGDYDLLLGMLLMDPWTQSEEQAEGLLNDIFSMPVFEKMKSHYKKKSIHF